MLAQVNTSSVPGANKYLPLLSHFSPRHMNAAESKGGEMRRAIYLRNARVTHNKISVYRRSVLNLYFAQSNLPHTGVRLKNTRDTEKI